MGKGFSILVWDDWGSGLVMVNPRIIDDGTLDFYGNQNNWFPYNSDEQKNKKIEELTKGYEHYTIVE